MDTLLSYMPESGYGVRSIIKDTLLSCMPGSGYDIRSTTMDTLLSYISHSSHAIRSIIMGTLLSYLPASGYSTRSNIIETLLSYVPDSGYGRVALVLFALASYLACLAIYRLFFSALAGFPGPKIAAVTGYYESYYDIFCDGRYIFKIKEMHEKYGPIVRINPNEISINDASYYDEVYVTASKRRTEHYGEFLKGIDFEGTHFLTTGHDLHRRRRKPLEPFFSRSGVSKLEPTVHEVVTRLIERFVSLKGSGTVIRVNDAFSSFAGDVMSKVCCESSMNFLEEEKFSPQWSSQLNSILHAMPVLMGFPFLFNILALIPPALLALIGPKSKAFIHFQELARKHILDAKDETANSKGSDTDGKISLFRYIFNSDMPESELSLDRLAKEAQVMFSAGTVNNARTLEFILYYVLAKDHIRDRLREELKDVMAGYPFKQPSWVELEKLPYLQAIIKEGLRLSYGVMHRLPRISPDVPLQYKEWTIPAGVPVGMSAYMMHSDPEVYDQPFDFIPERWLGNINPLMKRNFVPFTRGSRNCLGMNLAYVQLNFAIAALFGPEGPTMKLFDTDETDVIQVHDYLLPLPKLDSKGVRIVIE